MKRLLSVIMVLLTVLSALCLSASADSQPISLKYVPRKVRGTLFYIDVFSDTPVGAAVFALEYDLSAAEYYDLYCDDDGAETMANADAGTVGIVYSCRTGGSGKLFRVAFKAVSADTVRFTLHTTQAVDADLHDLSDVSAVSVEAKLGKEDAAASGSSSASKSKSSAAKSSKSSSGSSQKRYGGSQSDVQRADDDSAEHREKTDGGMILDLSEKNDTTFFLLGAAAAIFAGLLVALGVLIGKRMKKKTPTAEPDDEAAGEIDAAADETGKMNAVSQATEERFEDD